MHGIDVSAFADMKRLLKRDTVKILPGLSLNVR